ncbi:MAG: 2-amino-4-hydroxy-6-hydroxymethyldihydropteridine diphosphokinase [Rhodospirillales bacterium]|nr:2-amino-4-hydroxy-6-hydroxymethyldihydropteridine diphosphokinase [Rhodospirillales bacterium]
MTTAYLAIGSNLGDRVGNLRRAVAMLAPEIVLVASSPLYETAPAYVVDQPRFVNGALKVETALAPRALLTKLKDIEQAVGRQPGLRYGPRIVDLDILFYGDTVSAEDDLEIPHPRLAERLFVLRPLADIAPGLLHPVLKRTVAHLHEALADDPAMKQMTDTL